MSVCASVMGAADVLQQLKTTPAKASQEVVSSIAYGSVSTSGVRDVFRAASPAMRATLVEGALVWTKAYVSSPQFAKDYAKLRDEAKPLLEPVPSVDEELKERKAQRAADLAEAKKSVDEAPAEYRKMMQDVYKQAVEANKQFETAEFRRMEREGIEQEREAAQQQYRDELTNWEESYPADARVLMKQRLREFLAETANVDFDAKTVARGGKQRFANETYESKSSEWKLAYRAGKPATEKARAFATAWLAELK